MTIQPIYTELSRENTKGYYPAAVQKSSAKMKSGIGAVPAVGGPMIPDDNDKELGADDSAVYIPLYSFFLSPNDSYVEYRI